ncbi:MAG: diaminopimelate epimerase [Bacteroides sp.]|nr:diaminopimelate epimerase [Bacteroides sp.]MCM1379498.1 diaminopimelate epimerase [Bacteroides sp.]MCM1445899.1 diaminopimelate epimerase [Prevotella sp.]
MKAKFTKMHGLGNDYIYFTEMPCLENQLPALSRKLSDRHRSIGGDGIILVLPSEVADFKMRIFNADGSEAKMCGNGSRCVARLVSTLNLTAKETITLETLSGIKTLHIGPELITVEMGAGAVTEPVELQGFNVYPADMGNPHGVVFIDCLPAEFDVHGIGAALEVDPYFPDRANIEFAKVVDAHHIIMRVWERGSGETMACGTGACAAALAAIVSGRCESPVVVTLPGGDLEIAADSNNNVKMTGPAEIAFTGEVEF